MASGIVQKEAVPPEALEEDAGTTGRLSLGEESRALARARILQGAVSVLAEKGFDATIDDVAAAARVSRRTVFRHFATQGELHVAAVNDVMEVIGGELRALPPPHADVEAWLTECSVRLHGLIRRVVGRAFWDVHIQRPGTAPVVHAALDGWIEMRDRYTREFATTAWQAVGGRKAAPQWVVDAFVLQLSAFATNALVAYSPQEAGEVSARILWAVLSSALDAQG
ncbi:MAG TPA: TetR/AcrR family transcriptional regulator [Acidimicrobiales bacterium]|nr:TetR/AcrR family transcriptional regulator [Acidimicrobiales bacterium]